MKAVLNKCATIVETQTDNPLQTLVTYTMTSLHTVDVPERLRFTVTSAAPQTGKASNPQNAALSNPVPDLISRELAPPGGLPMNHLEAGHYSSVGLDDTFPPPPSPLVVRKQVSGRGESGGGIGGGGGGLDNYGGGGLDNCGGGLNSSGGGGLNSSGGVGRERLDNSGGGSLDTMVEMV